MKPQGYTRDADNLDQPCQASRVGEAFLHGGPDGRR